jgi:Acetyltransferase (GNAT) domain
MLTWVVLTEEDAADHWNALVLRLEDVGPFQSFEFGQSFKGLGWSPLHCACFDDDRHVVAAALCLIRRLPGGIAVGWCFGGPIGHLETWQGLPQTIGRHTGLRHVHVRFRCDRMASDADIRALEATGWQVPRVLMGRNLTLAMDLTLAEERLLAGFSKNWRRNLRRAQEQGLTIACNEPSIPLQLFDAYREMAEFKNLGGLIEFEKLKRLTEMAGETILVFAARDAEGRMLAFRCVLVLGNKAVDYLAATTVQGRQRHAAYLLLWEEVRALRARGITHYDLGGIDPEANPGVYRFKRDTGAMPVTLLGEWECGTSTLLVFGINLVIRLRALARRVRVYFGERFRGQAPENT